MMFGRGGSSRDREIIRLKLVTLAKKGPGRLVADREERRALHHPGPGNPDLDARVGSICGASRVHRHRDLGHRRGGGPDLGATAWSCAAPGAGHGAASRRAARRTCALPGPSGRRCWYSRASPASCWLATAGAPASRRPRSARSITGGTPPPRRRHQLPGPPRPASAPAGSASAAPPGPLLSSQSFASYAYPIWPGPANAGRAGGADRTERHGAPPGHGAVRAGRRERSAAGAAALLPARRPRLRVEASLGDDSGSSDYNLGDDGIVVTDATGRIVT